MAVLRIDHVNIGTAKLPETKAFFEEVLGLKEGWRPNFPFPGAWLYAGDTAVVHLVGLSEPKGPSDKASLDHFAFAIDSYEETRAKLDALAIAYQAVEVPGAPIRQIFIRDLNGVNIELNYRPSAPA